VKRYEITPRSDWAAQVEAVGFDFHTVEGTPYWDESAYWHFESAEVDVLEEAAERLHGMCMEAINYVIGRRLWPLFDIKPEVAKMIERSWVNREPTLYGRFDIAYDAREDPKLLEYNADTPTSLFEASIVQWQWRETVFPDSDQFNSIHEGLVQRWKDLRVGRYDASDLHLACVTPHPEDETTVKYMAATAVQGGFNAMVLPVQNIGLSAANQFVDMSERRIRRLFKLYPWEWLLKEDFGRYVSTGGTEWIEPIWKMLLSNKALLAVLWEMYPEHPNLLPAYTDSSVLRNRPHVRKPLLGREGANVTIIGTADQIGTSGPYGDGPFVYQGLAPNIAEPVPGGSAVLGLWMVNDKCRGMGIREETGLITTNLARFVPHVFTE
jgi:glutathionylspermidine synthase